MSEIGPKVINMTHTTIQTFGVSTILFFFKYINTFVHQGQISRSEIIVKT